MWGRVRREELNSRRFCKLQRLHFGARDQRQGLCARLSYQAGSKPNKRAPFGVLCTGDFLAEAGRKARRHNLGNVLTLTLISLPPPHLSSHCGMSINKRPPMPVSLPMLTPKLGGLLHLSESVYSCSMSFLRPCWCAGGGGWHLVYCE